VARAPASDLDRHASCSGAPVTESPLVDLDAERAILGAVLLDAKALDAALEILSASDFSDRRHQKILEAMISMRMASTTIDAITVSNELRSVADLVETRTYLSGLDTGLASTANVKFYAEIVKSLSYRRAMVRASESVFELARDSSLSPEELRSKSEVAIFDASRCDDRASLEHISGTLQHSIRDVEDRGRSSAPPGILSGLLALDQMLSGLRAGELVILAGRVGMGKSAFATCWAVNAARGGGSVAIFSLEMTGKEVTNRMLSARAMVDGKKFRSGQPNVEEWGRIMQGSDELGRLGLYIDPSGTVTVPEIASKLRRHKSRRGRLDLVVVDYLQLMDSARRSGSRAEDVAGISRSLKQLAKDLSVPILALAQLSRDVEKQDRRPRLSDLRESGAIEQDADAVIFIHASEEQTSLVDDVEVELIIGKQRNGPTGSVKALFLKPFSLFMDATPKRVGFDRASGEEE
jgi:replicative DNA helicase